MSNTHFQSLSLGSTRLVLNRVSQYNRLRAGGPPKHPIDDEWPFMS